MRSRKITILIVVAPKKPPKQSEPALTRNNRTVHIRHLCRKTAVLNCHRCLLNKGVEKMNYI
jgi:hypothetical protein